MLVTYSYSHRGGKRRIWTEKEEVNSTQRKKKSYKCDCEFIFKTIIYSMNTKSYVKVAKQAMAKIHVHSKHSGYNPGSEVDKYFLPVHFLVLSFATKNLKMMVSHSTVAIASLKEAKKFENMVAYFEQVTFRYFILVKEVEVLSYSSRLSGAFL